MSDSGMTVVTNLRKWETVCWSVAGRGLLFPFFAGTNAGPSMHDLVMTLIHFGLVDTLNM
jgi:hypothetical protein